MVPTLNWKVGLIALSGAVFALSYRTAARRLRRGAGGLAIDSPPPRDVEEKRFGYGSRDRVEEASWESFPASDPPAY